MRKKRAPSKRKIKAKGRSYPYLEKRESVPFLYWGEVIRFTFKNGLKVLFLQRKQSPVFSYQTWYRVGSRDEAPKYSGMAHLFEHMMFRGTKKRKKGEFDRLLESHGSQDLNAFTSYDHTVYLQSLPAESFSLVAELESDRMIGLFLNKKSFSAEREVVHNERKETQENSPEGKIFQQLQSLAFQKHPYRLPIIGLKEDLDRMEIKDLKKFYSQFYSPNNATIVIVGDLHEKQVLSTIGKFYGKISRSPLNGKRSAIAVEPSQTKERVKEIKLNTQLDKLFMGYKAPEAASSDNLPLDILSAVLTTGRSSKLYKSIIDSGLGIGLNSGSFELKDPSLFYFSLNVQSGKKPKKIIRTIDEVIAKIQKNGITPKELVRAKNIIKMNFYRSLLSNSGSAYFIGSGESTFGCFEMELASFAKLDSITPKDVQRVAKKYLSKSRRSVVIGKGVVL